MRSSSNWSFSKSRKSYFAQFVSPQVTPGRIKKGKRSYLFLLSPYIPAGNIASKSTAVGPQIPPFGAGVGAGVVGAGVVGAGVGFTVSSHLASAIGASTDSGTVSETV